MLRLSFTQPESCLSFAALESSELRLGIKLAGVLALRMLGLFLVLPVFMVLAADVPGYTPALAGLAIGIYGLTQAILQQPVGRLSDHWGRRRVMLAGLAVFSAGGVVAALAPTMAWLIAGRALQGCGAIAGVTLAFAADETHRDRRSVVMAMIGMGIGASFLLSIILSVPLAALLGLRGLFWLTSGLGVLGMLMLINAPAGRPSPDGAAANTAGGEVLQEATDSGSVWPLAISVFFLHALMTLFFVILPGKLIQHYELQLPQHWLVYVPTMLVSAVLVFPMLRKLAARNREPAALPWAFVGLGAALALFALPVPLPALLAGATLFFLAFNLLEASMPALVSHLTDAAGRGRKMGVYTTFQFLGAFAGGALGGWLLDRAGASMTLWLAALAALAWGGWLRLPRGQQAPI
jgi:MFS family permease